MNGGVKSFLMDSAMQREGQEKRWNLEKTFGAEFDYVSELLKILSKQLSLKNH